MSPVLIAGLVIAGLFVLIAIGYVNQLVEKQNLEKARLRAELNDRLRRCARLSDTLPGQMMKPELKLLLTRIELYLCERLTPLDKKNEKLHARTAQLRNEAAKGDEIGIQNAPVKIISEPQAKELRLMLEDLHALIVWAANQGQLETNDAKRWLAETQRMLVMLHVEYFNNLGRLAMQQSQAHKARLAFERGIQYIRKQQNQTDFQTHLQQFEANLQRANQLEKAQQQPMLDESNELTEGLKDFEDDDAWKKNNIY